MKFVKWAAIVVVALVVILFGLFKFMQSQTKKHSPEETIEYNKGNLHLSVYYNRPYKKGRVIFGELIPYGQVWRTGANEPTTFTTNKTINVEGKTLEAGTYAIFTIPGEKTWQVIFNNKKYGWGLKMSGESPREAKYDAAVVTVPVESLGHMVEQFTMSFEDSPELRLTLAWDKMKVGVRLNE